MPSLAPWLTPQAPNTRCITAILYLNGDWTPEDGGALRIYGDLGELETEGSGGSASDQFVEVEPRRGNVALFLSHRVPHEVMPARTARFALSLWMCVAPEQPPGWLSSRRFRRGTE